MIWNNQGIRQNGRLCFFINHLIRSAGPVDIMMENITFEKKSFRLWNSMELILCSVAILMIMNAVFLIHLIILKQVQEIMQLILLQAVQDHSWIIINIMNGNKLIFQTILHDLTVTNQTKANIMNTIILLLTLMEIY